MPISKELIQQLREQVEIGEEPDTSYKDLLDEIARLTHLHDLDHSLVDQKQAEIERLQGEVVKLENEKAGLLREIDHMGDVIGSI